MKGARGGNRGKGSLCQASQRRLFDFVCRSVDPGESCTLLKKWFVKMGVWYYRTIDLSATVCD